MGPCNANQFIVGSKEKYTLMGFNQESDLNSNIFLGQIFIQVERKHSVLDQVILTSLCHLFLEHRKTEVISKSSSIRLQGYKDFGQSLS